MCGPPGRHLRASGKAGHEYHRTARYISGRLVHRLERTFIARQTAGDPDSAGRVGAFAREPINWMRRRSRPLREWWVARWGVWLGRESSRPSRADARSPRAVDLLARISQLMALVANSSRRNGASTVECRPAVIGVTA